MVFLVVVALYKSGVWPGPTATVRGSFLECSSASCTAEVLSSRHLTVHFYQPGLLGRSIATPGKGGGFETRLPLGRYLLTVDGCAMPNGQPISFMQEFESGRDLPWTIDAHGVCTLGPEPPSGIFCCDSAGLLRDAQSRRLIAASFVEEGHSRGGH